MKDSIADRLAGKNVMILKTRSVGCSRAVKKHLKLIARMESDARFCPIAKCKTAAECGYAGRCLSKL